MQWTMYDIYIYIHTVYAFYIHCKKNDVHMHMYNTSNFSQTISLLYSIHKAHLAYHTHFTSICAYMYTHGTVHQKKAKKPSFLHLDSACKYKYIPSTKST